MGNKGIGAPELDESLVAAFERIAANVGSRIAVGSDGWQPTYRELNETANRLAHQLIDIGAGVGSRTAILMGHDAPMVAATIAAIKAGQIVVALDPGDPLHRLKLLVEDTEPSTILADAKNLELAKQFAPPGSHILNFETESATGSIANPSIEILPEQTAFITYTSGTTGRPKGVMRSHRQILRNIAAHTEAIQFTKDDRISLFSVISTGHGSAGIWRPLLNGAMLCPFPIKVNGISVLSDWIINRKLTVWVSSASIFRALVKTLDHRQVFSSVRAVQLTSESATDDDFRKFQQHFPPASVFVHMLSSTETSTIAWSRWRHDQDIPKGVLPVGQFARDIDVSLLGEDGRPVTRGEVGEIVVKSRYVANGYWRQPVLLEKRFSADPDNKGARTVWTGDLGRINSDGLLELHGRKDDRVKIRGNRIELREIDRAIERVSGIECAATIAVPGKTHEPVLAAFVVKAPDVSWTVAQLRNAVRENLPIHMVPSRIVFLDSLPYNQGNKIDREALRQYLFPASIERKSEKPKTHTEALLASIWSEVLELLDVDRSDDFFNLGGDSLKGAVVAAQVYSALGVELSLGTIADHPTISTLAKYIDAHLHAGAANTAPIVRAARTAPIPVSLYQEHFWSRRASPECNHVHYSRIDGPLDVEIYKDCLNYLTERHEILRTTFETFHGSPVQIIRSAAPLSFRFIDLSCRVDPEGEADVIVREMASKAFNVEKLPLVRHVLIKIADDKYILARVISVMTSDGFSSRILDEELAILYEARLQGRQPPLSKQAPLHYADYALWQRQIAQPESPLCKEMLSWWKNALSTALPSTRLPLKNLFRGTKLVPNVGVIGLAVNNETAKQLNDTARSFGTTPFVVCLAAFAALVSDISGNSTVVIWTAFDNRNRSDMQTIVGPVINFVPLIFSFDARIPFSQWLKIVHSNLFGALQHSELPFHKIAEQLQAAGMNPPHSEIVFLLSRENSDLSFGSVCKRNEPFTSAVMPGGCAVYIDGKKPENSQLRFDAEVYNRDDLSALIYRYIQLLQRAATCPDLQFGTLFSMIGSEPMRWEYKKYVESVRDLLLNYYAASPLLKMIWRPVRSYLLRRG